MCGGGTARSKQREACIAAGLTLFFGLAHADDKPHVAITESAVIIEAKNASLHSVLEELSRKTGLAVTSQAALDEAVAAGIDEPTLQQAIRRLLRHRSYLLLQSRDAECSLWIFADDPEARTKTWAPPTAPPPEPDHDRELIDYQILAVSDAAKHRREAMYGFGETSDDVALLLPGLSDPDVSVREEAILSIADIGGGQSVAALGIALSDSVARVRMDAVDALGEVGGPDATAWLWRAMADEDPTVREAASEWLIELERMPK